MCRTILRLVPFNFNSHFIWPRFRTRFPFVNHQHNASRANAKSAGHLSTEMDFRAEARNLLNWKCGTKGLRRRVWRLLLPFSLPNGEQVEPSTAEKQTTPSTWPHPPNPLIEHRFIIFMRRCKVSHEIEIIANNNFHDLFISISIAFPSLHSRSSRVFQGKLLKSHSLSCRHQPAEMYFLPLHEKIGKISTEEEKIRLHGCEVKKIKSNKVAPSINKS